MHCISCGHSVYNCSMNRMIWTVAIVGISLLGCKPLSNSGDRVERAGQPDVIGVDRGDVQMKEAENKARARLDYFIEKLQKRSDPSTEYAVKFPLPLKATSSTSGEQRRAMTPKLDSHASWPTSPLGSRSTVQAIRLPCRKTRLRIG